MRSGLGRGILALVVALGIGIAAHGCTSGEKEEAAADVNATEAPAAQGEAAPAGDEAAAPAEGEKKKKDGKKHGAKKHAGKKAPKKPAKKKK